VGEHDNLTLEAQLNVDADKYFQLANGKLRPIVSLLPSCDAMLSIRGISVTSNYRKQLIRAYVEPEYIIELLSRHLAKGAKGATRGRIYLSTRHRSKWPQALAYI
jgi:hypothetical protein